MIRDTPLATLVCTVCREVVQILGDDRLTPEADDYVCVYCLDPRQREFDEFQAAEAEAMGAA